MALSVVCFMFKVLARKAMIESLDLEELPLSDLQDLHSQPPILMNMRNVIVILINLTLLYKLTQIICLFNR